MQRKVKIGLEIEAKMPLGERPALLCNEASCTPDFRHATSVLSSRGIRLSALFGPQHGISITDQANMIEWESDGEKYAGIPTYSLYGAVRSPKNLHEFTSLIVDLQEVGARYYTYIWTTLLCLEACSEAGIPLILLDRPNPLGGVRLEGPGILPGYESFVGLESIPIRHSCTYGELLRLFAVRKGLTDFLQIVPMQGWSRDQLWPETGLPWLAPSPNMPDFETAILYPGACLLEATNISEGRGTAMPFKFLGAPWISAGRLADALNELGIFGVGFRPISFKPCWDKYSDRICSGVQVHVTKVSQFDSVKCFYKILSTIKRLWPVEFAWAEPPYEYEFEKPPIDILTGSKAFREALDSGSNLEVLFEDWSDFYREFEEEIANILIYKTAK